MFTKDDLLALVSNEGRDAVAAAVAKIPEEDVRGVLMSLVMLYQSSAKMETDLWNKEHARCDALEDELKKAQERICALEKNN